MTVKMSIHPTTNGKVRCVIYVRYSSHNQNIESAEAQIRACEEYAAKHNMVVLYIYQDLELTGKNMEKRDELKKLLNDSERGLFDVVLVHKLDRIGRNTEEYMLNDKKLEENNVQLIALDSPFGNDANGKFFKQLLMAVNERFSSNLADEISYKTKEYARKGYYLGGVPPFGYEVTKFADNYGKTRNRLIVNEKEAKVVKYIFESYSKGIGVKKIVNELYSLGEKTRQGNTISAEFTRRLLSSDVYIGTYSHAKKKKNKNDKSEPIIIENNHEAIIDKETFYKVQKLKKKNPFISRQRYDSNNTPKRKYFLTGIMRCSCGYSLTAKGGNKLYRYYQCTSKSHKHDVFCDNKKGVRQEQLEDKVLEILTNKLFTDENIKVFNNLIVSNLIENDNSKNELDKIKKEKNKMIKRFQKVEESYFSDFISRERFVELKKEHEESLELIDKKIFELEIQNLPINEEIINDYLYHLKNNILQLNDNTKELIVKSVIDKILVSKDNIDIYFNVFNPYPPDYDTGNNFEYICDKDTHALANESLSQKGISIYKLNNGVHLGHINIKR